ncbi:PPOX class F420-dependent oxidoreductase [Nocardioides jensenii]|uniref:PPOX class F420-dependent oxidoreductase n=1 Tax=Nocardioides jensenii TaxID=1843 RepID=UPI000830DB15|nr:PPOX class F420-dependent oxidoreductase [Nocardioides jensenii]
MELDEALETARRTRESVLTTIRRDGRPQLSNVLHAVGDHGTIRVSTTGNRAKFNNMAREPWVALHVNGDNFFSYAVIEGTAALSSIAQDPDDDVVDELVDLYRALVGEHDDWNAYRRAMVDEGRAVVTMTPTRAYGMLQLPKTSGT